MSLLQGVHDNRTTYDDFVFTRHRDDLVPGTIFVNPDWVPVYVHVNGGNALVDWYGSHSSMVDAVYLNAGTHDLTVTVVEKFRVSALYRKTFTMVAMCPNKYIDPMAHTHSGHCSMMFENADVLPWSPIGFYREKP